MDTKETEALKDTPIPLHLTLHTCLKAGLEVPPEDRARAILTKLRELQGRGGVND